VKTHNEDGDKVFINICQTSEVPAPEDITEADLVRIWSSEDHSSYRIPMSIGEGHEEADKGNSCSKRSTSFVYPLITVTYEYQVTQGFSN